MSRRVALALGCLVATSALGCEKETERYAGLRFDVVSAAPIPARLESDLVELPAGVAVFTSVIPRSSEKPYTRRDVLSLRAEDPEVLDVFSGTDPFDFVLVGLAPGRTCLRVTINRSEKECIDVRVEEQPE